MFLPFSAGGFRWSAENRSHRPGWRLFHGDESNFYAGIDGASTALCTAAGGFGSLSTTALPDVCFASTQALLSQLQQPLLINLKGPHLLQYPLLLLLAHKPRVRPSAIPRTLRISKKLSDNPLRPVDATITEAELGYREGVLQLLRGFVLACLVQIVNLYA
jgi:hypothetical protein